MNAMENLVERFKMQPHPEGGWYSETYRSPETIIKTALPERFTGDRSFSTAIYFLLPASVYSAFHRIKSDECWHFYDGLPLDIYVIDEHGVLTVIKLGRDIHSGERYQAVVRAGCWFASIPSGEEGYSFVGCTVSPGFDFEDFELADCNYLSARFPQHAALINQLCRK